MKNNIADLSDILLDELGRLDDIEITDKDALGLELNRAKAKVDIAKSIIDIANVQLEAVKLQTEWNLKAKEMPALIAQKQIGDIPNTKRLINGETASDERTA